MIKIVDYQMGNLRSVQKAFEKVGAEAEIIHDPNQVAEAQKLVLPGVGAFRDAIAHLHDAKLVEPIKDFIRGGQPFLGICLGLQMLFTKSLEDGEHEGLDVFPGQVVRFAVPSPMKVPHMGWNQVKIVRQAPVLEGIPDQANFYFVHSYHVVPDDPAIIATSTDYGVAFTSMVWHENVFACQFHPEKSQRLGLEILRNFAQL